jgi:hypothetical protein
MKRQLPHFMVSVTLIFFSVLFTNRILAQSKVVIPGTFQSELGCTEDWSPDCDNTALIYNSSTRLWTGSFTIPAGCQQYKVAIDGTWEINYGKRFTIRYNFSVRSGGNPGTFSYNPKPICGNFTF